MNKTDREFERLTDKFIEDMESVKCPMSAFVAALKDAADRIMQRRMISKAEMEDDDG